MCPGRVPGTRSRGEEERSSDRENNKARLKWPGLFRLGGGYTNGLLM